MAKRGLGKAECVVDEDLAQRVAQVLLRPAGGRERGGGEGQQVSTLRQCAPQH